MPSKYDGAVFVLLIFLSSFLGSIFLLAPLLPLAFFAPRVYRNAADRLVGYWLTFPASLLIFIFKVKFRVTGDLIDRRKPAIILMNHRTRLDWLFFWNALYKMDPWLLTTEKISLKAGLKSIPGAGWAMAGNGYIFLNRNYAKDQKVMETMLQYYKESQNSYQLLLFPEGTDRGERAVSIDHAYADKNGLQKYDYLLHPRTTGFNFIFNELRKNNYLEAVYDVTIAYPDEIVASEIDLFKKGVLPSSVHFDVKAYSLDEILTPEQMEVDKKDPVDTAKWMNELWAAKEERLKKFYTAEEGKKELEPSGARFVWPVETNEPGYLIAFATWVTFILLAIYLLIFFWPTKYYFLAVVIAFVVLGRLRGGMEFLIAELFFGRRLFLEKDR
uniref:PlsC domain-containing protein n=1 Tax=Panagrellus redivivus TaxID=6233 RepID=A0A7E4VIT4_PANRE